MYGENGFCLAYDVAKFQVIMKHIDVDIFLSFSGYSFACPGKKQVWLPSQLTTFRATWSVESNTSIALTFSDYSKMFLFVWGKRGLHYSAHQFWSCECVFVCLLTRLQANDWSDPPQILRHVCCQLFQMSSLIEEMCLLEEAQEIHNQKRACMVTTSTFLQCRL